MGKTAGDSTRIEVRFSSSAIMPARKSAPAQPACSEDDRIDRLTEVLEILSQEVHILREALDELREQYVWALNNRDPAPASSPFVPLTSIPRDPLDREFGAKINQTKSEDVPAEEQAQGCAGSGELF